MTAERVDLDAFAALLEAATPGPWEVPESIHGDPYITERGRGFLRGGGIALADHRDDYGRSNAALIVAAVNALPALLAEVKDAREAKARVEALHNGTHWCFNADRQAEVYEPGSKWWPCPTRAALTRGGEQP